MTLSSRPLGLRLGPQTGLAASGEEEIIWIIAGEIFPANQDERVNIDPRPQAVP